MDLGLEFLADITIGQMTADRNDYWFLL